MLQRSSVNPVSAATDVVDVWSRPSTRSWLGAAKEMVALPTTLRGFTRFLLALLLIAAAIVMQVYLSAQILETELEINALQAELDSAERVNAEYAWQISILSRIENVAARATALGFVPVTDEIFVERNATQSPAVSEADPLSNYATGPLDGDALTGTSGSGQGLLPTWIESTGARVQQSFADVGARIDEAVANTVKRWIPSEY